MAQQQRWVMAAFNWIVAELRCPACGEMSHVRSQTHVASDFGGVDVRFHDREYRLGEPMAWWPRDHPRHGAWREHAVHANDGDAYEEACLAICGDCGAELYVVIRFRDAVPEAVIAVGLEGEWPDGYPR